MAMNYPEKSNPFADDDDEMSPRNSQGRYTSSRTVTSTTSAGTKISHYGHSGAPGGIGWGDDGADDWEKPKTRYEELQDQKQNSINNQKETMQRAIASIYESERMGIATAEELVHQGEQLDNVEKKTDEINQTLTTSQKHLNNIKSIFGGFKNWWNKDKKEEQAQEEKKGPRTERLRQALDQDRSHLQQPSQTSPDDHPALRMRNDTSGFYESQSPTGADPFRENDPFREPQQGQRQLSTSMTQYEKEFDDNLGVMSDGMSRLKGLALGLGDEIERQNDQLERITGKVDTTGDKLEGQNKQIRKVLYN